MSEKEVDQGWFEEIVDKKWIFRCKPQIADPKTDITTLRVINDFYAYCYACRFHIYSQTYDQDHYSQFFKHLNESKHRISVEKSPKIKEIITYENSSNKWTCNACKVEVLPTILAKKQSLQVLIDDHKAKVDHKYNAFCLEDSKMSFLLGMSLCTSLNSFISPAQNNLCSLCNKAVWEDVSLHERTQGHLQGVRQFIDVYLNFKLDDIKDENKVRNMLKILAANTDWQKLLSVQKTIEKKTDIGEGDKSRISFTPVKKPSTVDGSTPHPTSVLDGGNTSYVSPQAVKNKKNSSKKRKNKNLMNASIETASKTLDEDKSNNENNETIKITRDNHGDVTVQQQQQMRTTSIEIEGNSCLNKSKKNRDSGNLLKSTCEADTKSLKNVTLPVTDKTRDESESPKINPEKHLNDTRAAPENLEKINERWVTTTQPNEENAEGQVKSNSPSVQINEYQNFEKMSDGLTGSHAFTSKKTEELPLNPPIANKKSRKNKKSMNASLETATKSLDELKINKQNNETIKITLDNHGDESANKAVPQTNENVGTNEGNSDINKRKNNRDSGNLLESSHEADSKSLKNDTSPVPAKTEGETASPNINKEKNLNKVLSGSENLEKIDGRWVMKTKPNEENAQGPVKSDSSMKTEAPPLKPPIDTKKSKKNKKLINASLEMATKSPEELTINEKNNETFKITVDNHGDASANKSVPQTSNASTNPPIATKKKKEKMKNVQQITSKAKMERNKNRKTDKYFANTFVNSRSTSSSSSSSTSPPAPTQSVVTDEKNRSKPSITVTFDNDLINSSHQNTKENQHQTSRAVNINESSISSPSVPLSSNQKKKPLMTNVNPTKSMPVSSKTEISNSSSVQSRNKKASVKTQFENKIEKSDSRSCGIKINESAKPVPSSSFDSSSKNNSTTSIANKLSNQTTQQNKSELAAAETSQIQILKNPIRPSKTKKTLELDVDFNKTMVFENSKNLNDTASKTETTSESSIKDNSQINKNNFDLENPNDSDNDSSDEIEEVKETKDNAEKSKGETKMKDEKEEKRERPRKSVVKKFWCDGCSCFNEAFKIDQHLRSCKDLAGKKVKEMNCYDCQIFLIITSGSLEEHNKSPYHLNEVRERRERAEQKREAKSKEQVEDLPKVHDLHVTGLEGVQDKLSYVFGICQAYGKIQSAKVSENGNVVRVRFWFRSDLKKAMDGLQIAYPPTDNPHRFSIKESSILENLENVLLNENIAILLSDWKQLEEHCWKMSQLALHVMVDPSEKKREEELFVDLKSEIGRFLAPDWRFILFGSRRTGLSLTTSDADIFAGNEAMYMGDMYQSPGDQRAIVDCVEKFMKKSAVFECLRSVARARVPIIIFRHKPTNIQGDLSFMNGLSSRNTRLIQCMLSLDDRPRPMIMFLKQWVADHGLKGILTSYAVTLLVFVFLARLDRPVLPAMSQLRPQNLQPMIIAGMNTSFSEKIMWRSTNRESVSQLLLQFFYYYGTFDFANNFIYTLGACFYSRSSLKGNNIELPNELRRVLWKMNRVGDYDDRMQMCVMDPFDLKYNTTKRIKNHAFHMIMKLFKQSYLLLWESLKQPNQLS